MSEINASTVLTASIFKAAGDPMRLEILRIMRCDSFGVLELCKLFSIQQPSMSHHLKVLANAGLVTTRREGNSIYYRRGIASDVESQKLLGAFFDIVDGNDVSAQLAENLEKVQLTRGEQAKAFFRDNAERFHEQQDLIASHRDYGCYVRDMLAVHPHRTWIEVGPGDGELLSELVQSFAKVVAIDTSTEMLAHSQARLAEEDRGKVDFCCKDTTAASAEGMQADVISCNMVLHHVPSPATMVAEMATMLASDGQLVITDLDQHDQDWARQSCGDLWLGFSPEQLDSWAEAAGLNPGRSEFLALRNGFRVQIREYLKDSQEIL